MSAAVASADQDPPQVISPLRSETDVNGVNLTDGKKNVEMPVVLATPADPRLTFDKVQNSAPYISGSSTGDPNATTMNQSYSVHSGAETSESFQCLNGDCQGVTFSGSRLIGREYTRAPGGEVYHFNVLSLDATSGSTHTTLYYASSVSYPDGETISYTYDSGFEPGDVFNQTFYRPNKISSNTGYYITVSYQNTGTDITQVGWSDPAQASLYAPDGTLIRRITYNSNATVTDLGSGTTGGRTFASTVNNGMAGSVEQIAAAITLPGETANELILNPVSDNGPGTNQLIASIVRDGVQWNYNYVNPRTYTAVYAPGMFDGNLTECDNALVYDSITVSGPNGYNVTYQMEPQSFFSLCSYSNYIKSKTDALGHTTSYTYTASNYRGFVTGYKLTGITLPEGNSVSLTYDDCGNVIQKISVAKPGSGLASLNESATYATDENAASPELICPTVNAYRPTTYTDALGRVTNYTYNADGQMTQELDPASGGVRRETDITYATSLAGISRRTLVRVCGNTTTCAGHAESHTEYTYLGDTNLPLTVTQKDESSGATRTTTYTYDNVGRPTVVDGPLAGTDDATYFQYDIYGRKTWEVGERAPNGLRIAKNFAYRDSDDKVTSVKTGTVSCVSACNTAALTLTLLQQTDTSYDSRRYAIRAQTYKASTSLLSVTDSSFLDRGLSECIATRMNLAAPPASSGHGACILSDSSDRITESLYDAAGQLTTIEKAVGTSLQQNYASYSYSANGKQQTVADANGNVAQFLYDGFDRLSKWEFPSKTTPGTVNTADFESYGYDNVGNRTSLRKRDGSNVIYAYDGLNRVISKSISTTRTDLTAAQKRPVFFSYDVMGRQLGAKFDSATGADGITSAYDGFGEPTSSTLTMGTFSKTLTSAYDSVGNRSKLTHPDNNSFSYCYDALGRLSSIGQGTNCTTTTLETFSYGNNGLVSKRSEGAGAGVSSASYGYDDIGRLNSQSDIFGSATNNSNVNWAFSFNPASEIASEARTIPNSTTDPYAYGGLLAVNRAYAVNGLNQYTAAGPASFAYDANGNLTSDGSNTYTYDVENRLVTAVGSGVKGTTTNLTYDPLGRLFQVDQGTLSSTTKFLYDGDALAAEFNSSNALTDRYVHGSNAAADDPLLWFSSSSLASLHYLHADHLGSIVAIANSNGSSFATNAYDEYGINDSGNNTDERFGYTGQAFVPELGMYYYKARFYSPTLGRFLQTDPVGYKDQINLYEYVGDDPVDYNDPTGNETPCAGKGGNCGESGDAAKQFKEHPVRTILATGAFVAPLAAAAAPEVAAGVAAMTAPTPEAAPVVATGEAAAVPSSTSAASGAIPNISEISARAANPLRGTRATIEVPGKAAQRMELG
jgi:RHS repeat-associated protein